MGKIVEGQLNTLVAAAEMTRGSNSIASQNIRDFVGSLTRMQTYTPDVLPRMVDLSALAERTQGKIVDAAG